MTSYSPSATGVEETAAPPAAGRGWGPWEAALRSPRAHARELVKFGVVFGQLALLVGVIRLFDIENAAFEGVMTLVLVAFAVNHFLPVSWRLPFFAAVSLLSLVVALDARSAVWIVGLGGLLLGACHLPIAFGRRVALLCGLAMLLAGVRVEAWWAPRLLSDVIPSAIWPILGSMFMFRLIVYLYELRHGGAPFSFWRAVAYFFMVPNACFPLFPVVDYKAFCRGHYGDDAYRIYRVGLSWILRGVVHLVVYRVIYQNLVIEPSAAANLRDVGQYMLATFLLYLKVSGTFHLIVGTLRLFGFDLPETHHRYLLTAGFTDFWRRINIYWKDFIQTLVFYPLFFRLRGLGKARAMMLATLLAFAATWLLHSYQWFWIRGTFPITWTDAVFWLGLGLAVVVGVALELRPRRLREAGTSRSVQARLGLALRTAGTFTSICVLWTIWSTPSSLELRELLAGARVASAGDVLLVLLAPATIGLLAVLLERRQRPQPEATRSVPTRDILGSGLLTTAACVVLVAVGSDAAWARLGLEMPRKLAEVKRNKLNDNDVQTLERGYYEDLGDPARFNSDLLVLYGGKPPGWDTNPATRLRSDVLSFDLAPSITVTYKGGVLTTNSMGMRDREYPGEKTPGTFRAVLLGASHEMGTGVGGDETYENVVEDRLNRDAAASGGRRYEILNFAVGGYGALQKLAMLEQRAFAFDPDLVLYVAHSTEFDAAGRRLSPVVSAGGEIPYEFVRRLVESAEVGKGDNPHLITKRLRPHGREIVRWAFQRLSEQCRNRGTRAAVVLLEKLAELEDPGSLDELRRMATEAGMDVLDLRGAYAGVRSRKSLWIAKWDNHPNAEGHRVLADRLYQALIASDAFRSLSNPVPATTSR